MRHSFSLYAFFNFTLTLSVLFLSLFVVLIASLWSLNKSFKKEEKIISKRPSELFKAKVNDILQMILKQSAEFHNHINTKNIRGEKKKTVMQ